MDARAFLDDLKEHPWYQGQLAHVESLPPRPPGYADFETPLPRALEAALKRRGQLPLYRHQAEALAALGKGRNVIVATPAASGKSLCYQLPLLQAVMEGHGGSALLLYPTKALAQDQLRSLNALAPSEARLRAAIYDGDTPQPERSGIRRRAQVLLTNPDMLHVGILPNHSAWGRLLQGLRYVVVDEAHVYRGVFGSHTADVLRRLRRICARYGARPQFILCSATIANPGELAEALVGLPFDEVTADGSPSGGREFAFWNPPLLDGDDGFRRRSASMEAARLFADLVKCRVRTLTFVRTRRQAELVYSSVRDILHRAAPPLAAKIAPYRGTYLPEDRRRIEAALAQGQLLGVATTNALELGIDIGHLDASVLAGYPGSVASTWQQAGRSGRREDSSLAVLVGRDDPLDQYLMRHPDFFFGRPHEHARIAPDNPYILAPHLLCAAYESPLTPSDEELFGPGFASLVEGLVEQGLVRKGRAGWFLAPSVTYPAQDTNLRSATTESYTVVEEGTGRLLEAGIEVSAAMRQLHPGAVYLHHGRPFVVQELDMDSRTAVVSLSDADYYTQARDVSNTQVLQVHRQKHASRHSTVFYGDVEVTSQVVAYVRMAPYLEKSLGRPEPLDLPVHRFRTTALWFDVPQRTIDRIRDEDLSLTGGLHAVEHAAIGVLPLFALCDRNDIGGLSTDSHRDTGGAAVFIHDGYPGGIGIAEHGFEVIRELWQATLQAVEECPCQSGCPGCIQSPKCGNNNYPLDKAAAVILLRGLLGIGR